MDKAQIAQDLAQKIFDFMGAEVKITSEVTAGRVRVNASLEEAGFLIGRDGENLKAFQYVLMLMTAKKIGETLTPADFVFDINNYQKEKEDYLIALAKNSAHQALENKKAVELPPMTALERKIIHLAVEQIGGVKSESVGEGEERRVIISLNSKS